MSGNVWFSEDVLKVLQSLEAANRDAMSFSDSLPSSVAYRRGYTAALAHIAGALGCNNKKEKNEWHHH